MKRLLALLLLLAFPALAQPTTPFPTFLAGQNPTSIPLGSTDVLPVVQSGVTTKLARPFTSINGTTCYLTDSCTVAISPGSIALTNTHILVGNGSNLAADVAISGVLAITNLGVTSLNANAVTTAAIANAQVTYAKLQNETTVTLLGNPTGSLAAPSEITLGSGLSFSGTTLVATGTGGTVTSVGLSVPGTSIFGTSGSPVTTTGTLGLTTTGTSGGIPYFSSTSQLASSALLTANAIMLGGGAGATPVSLGSLGNTVQLLHGNPSGPPSFSQLVTADITAANVTYSKLQNEATVSLLGNPTGAPASPSEITLGSGLAFSGTTLTATGSGGTVTSVTCNAGLSGGTFTTTGTCSLNLSNANTWAAVQTFGNGDLSLSGSSSGHTLLEASATASGTITFPAATDTVAVLGTAQTFTATNSSTPQTLTISTATFTPAAAAGNNIKFQLVHASCPCTFANPSGTPVAGTSGVIEIQQSSTGSDTIGTWGSQYLYPGGTATITLSTAVSATDTFSYYVRDSTHIVLTTAALNATH